MNPTPTDTTLDSRPTVGARIRALTAYLVPTWLHPFVVRRDEPFERHHAAQATGLDVFVAGIVGICFVYVAFFSWAMVYAREVYERAATPTSWTVLGLFGVWLILTAAGCTLALTASRGHIPFAARLGGRRWIRRTVGTLSLAAYLFVAALAVFAVHSTRLARNFDGRPARVYVLYDSMGFVPRWVLTVGAYQLCGAANKRWGDGSCVVAEISPSRLRTACRSGSLVYLATHGSHGRLFWSGTWLGPDAARDVAPPGPYLRFVYIAACDSGVGDARAAWEAAFAPATVVTFDRLSANIEHAWWLWVESPGVIAGLGAPSG